MANGAPVDRIAPKRPRPSILTAARDRSADAFGPDVAGPDAPSADEANGPTQPLRVRWATGIQSNSVNCAQGGAWKRCPSQAEVDAGKVVGKVVGPYEFDVFFPYLILECDHSRIAGEAPLTKSASDLLDARAPWHVARALWMGEGLGITATQPTLRNSAVDVTAFDPSLGGPMDLDQAFAVLADAFDTATQGLGEPVYHMPKRLLPFASGGGGGGATVVRREGDYLRANASDAMVSIGPGYPIGASPGTDLAGDPNGFGPEVNPADPQNDYKGTDVDEAWVYISGTIEYALADITSIEDDDSRYRRNSFAVEAIRPAIVRFDPCSVFAARVAVPIAGVS